MKFAQHLTAHVTPEWHKQYIRYDFFKEFIYKVNANAPPPDECSVEDRQRYIREQDDEFFRLCAQELTKVESFFCEKLAEANRKFAELIADLTDLQSSGELPISAVDIEVEPKSRMNSPQTSPTRRVMAARDGFRVNKKLRELKLAFSEFYLSLILLQSYQQLNAEGFRKMLKKHDKVFDTKTGANWRDKVVYEKSFKKNREVDALIQKVESLFTNALEHGDRTRAMKRLRVPPLSARHSAWVTFRVGVLFGIVTVLLFCAILVGVFAPVDSILAEIHNPAIRIFRGSMLLIVFIAFCGANSYGWRKAGVNHVLIFEINPRSHLSPLQLLEMALVLAVVWFIALILYLLASAHLLLMPPYIAPFSLLFILLLVVFVPFSFFYANARKWLIRKLGRCFAAPFRRVQFADFWLADQLNSLVLALSDLKFAICFFSVDFGWVSFDFTVPKTGVIEANSSVYNYSYSYSSPSRALESTEHCSELMVAVSPIIYAIPALIRFLQCWRRYYDGPVKWHLLNAGKYSTTFFVIIFSSLYGSYPNVKALLVCWILSALASTIYGYVWDVTMDWGLFDKRASPENRFLREELVYRIRGFYYAAIIENLLIRFAWVANLLMKVLVGYAEWQKELVRTGVAFAEAFRRCIWNFFRLENEHVNNCGRYRAVRDISIAPVSDRDYSLLENIMDSEEELLKLRSDQKVKRQQQIRQMIANDGDRTVGLAGAKATESLPRRRKSVFVQFFAKRKQPSGPDHETLACDDELLQDFWNQLQLTDADDQVAEEPPSRVA